MIVDGVWIGKWNIAHLQLGITSNYNIAQATTIHTGLLSFLQPPLVVAWLQSSNKECPSRTRGSRSAIPNRLLKTVLLCPWSKSESRYDRRSVSRSWCQAPSGVEGQIFVTAR
jgi:hypothetical protein